ncbi:hypothetical protein [Leucobacter sp. GX24907]
MPGVITETHVEGGGRGLHGSASIWVRQAVEPGGGAPGVCRIGHPFAEQHRLERGERLQGFSGGDSDMAGERLEPFTAHAAAQGFEHALHTATGMVQACDCPVEPDAHCMRILPADGQIGVKSNH